MTAMPRRHTNPARSIPEDKSSPHPLSWKRVYDKPASGDGMRVLVDRLWPRGIRKQDLRFDEWWKDLAPSTELRKWFGHDPARWNEFRRRYAAELAARSQALACLREALQRGPVTLLTASKNEHCNHAVALMELIGNPP
jgi:uncharacterized protein YeaO (DUF488 family)